MKLVVAIEETGLVATASLDIVQSSKEIEPDEVSALLGFAFKTAKQALHAQVASQETAQ